MLLLTRRVGEAIMIGDEVVISITGVNGNQVRIGIDAPKSIAVHREEIYERIQAEKSSGRSSGRPGYASADGPAHQPAHQVDDKGWIRASVPPRFVRGSGGNSSD